MRKWNNHKKASFVWSWFPLRLCFLPTLNAIKNQNILPLSPLALLPTRPFFLLVPHGCSCCAVPQSQACLGFSPIWGPLYPPLAVPWGQKSVLVTSGMWERRGRGRAQRAVCSLSWPFPVAVALLGCGMVWTFPGHLLSQISTPLRVETSSQGRAAQRLAFVGDELEKC